MTSSAPASVQEHRNLIPINNFISSTGSHGSLMVTDVYIFPEKLDEFIAIVTPVVHHMRAMPECLFCEISQDPTDPAHIRIQHSWTKGTEWFTGACESQQWFADYVKGLAGIADKSRGRSVSHFNRIPID
ncbi:uncharacterized protein Z520_10799 [Fonsecaea multimorphosa CBS 102226]|uniref:ABM domain-containing protein n=1 Tax=Fonsecaea multimorphosa CBS 102226 TaxID=1442371 RepID=A0A0D2GV17_9EURO|nr:uncharacterized protein Z520_10799 [Fonsecaea multimorphosa CBS 102226]KIX93380.1 hypothetical protein Z520_10799 [Fonsecaea multimorphosa CBS 102226]OAL18680.1 hypothetical protein AYO22_10373 [Fonsecaea multimorphosa]